MAEEQVGCAKPTGAVIGDKAPPEKSSENGPGTGERAMVTVKVGGKAPDFEAPAYHKGKFVSIKLSDYAGKWVLLCFYPGDFTFV
jgi:hypothetical protein